MKKPISPHTIERYVRYPMKNGLMLSYPEIVAKAVNSGWKYEKQELTKDEYGELRTVRIVNDKGYFYEVAYHLNDVGSAMYNHYGFPKR